MRTGVFMRKIILAVLLISTFHAHSSECNTNETLIASCSLSGKVQRVAAFCANKKDNTLYYTFKNKSVAELVVHFNSGNKLKRWVDLGTYTTYFGFNQGAYSYVLGVPEERPGVSAFLDVKKNGSTVSSKKCDSNSFGEKDIKNNSIEDVLDSSVRDNGFKFP
jgi:hypothetical protein